LLFGLARDPSRAADSIYTYISKHLTNTAEYDQAWNNLNYHAKQTQQKFHNLTNISACHK